MADVEVNNVRKAYGSVEVIHGIDLTIRSGELTVLLGPSGCGKSTLLRMIAGLEDITSGTISIDKRPINDVAPSKRGCSMVFQNYALYPHKTVFKNIAFPLQMAGSDRATIERRVRETAELLQIESLLERLPRDLSGGQRQRVAMGRAMIREPKVFLFDEPLSNLDAELRVRMRMEISRLQRSLGATMVFVTHDQVEAMTLADRIVVMRAGHIEQVGPPLEVYRDPANRFVASFLGSPAMNFLPIDAIADPTNGRANGVSVEPSASVVGVRPEHVGVARTRERSIPLSLTDAKVVGTEHLGDRSYLHLATGSGEITLLQGEEEPFQERSEPKTLYIDPSHLHFFDRDGRSLRGRSRAQAQAR